MLRKLNWPTLIQHKEHLIIIMLHKIIYEHI